MATLEHDVTLWAKLLTTIVVANKDKLGEYGNHETLIKFGMAEQSV